MSKNNSLKSTFLLLSDLTGFQNLSGLSPLLCALILLFNISCHSLRTVAPTHESETPKPIVKPSEISVPVSIDIKDLEAKINKEMSGLIYQDDNLKYENNTLMIKAWKLEDFTISINKNILTYRIPLKLWIKYNFSIEKFGFKVSDSREINAEIALNYNTAVSFNSDWTLATKTTSKGYEWINAPTLSIAGINIPLTFIADLFMNSFDNSINNNIDESINKYIPLKKYMQDAWNMLQQPLKVNDEFNTWVIITPTDISVIPITSNNNIAHLTIAIKSFNKVYFGQEPPPFVPASLPNLNIANKLDPLFSLNINLNVPFTEINQLAQSAMIGKVYTEGKRKIEIKNINIYGSNDRFIVDVTVKGSLNGDVYLAGKPVFNATDKSIEIKDVDFDINTKNALIKSAGWLLHGAFINLIEPKLKYPIADKIDEGKTIIGQYLNNNKSIKGMTLNGELKNLDIDNIYITNESVNAVIYLEGSLSVDIDGLSKM